jgi:hypothetical protein
MFLFDVVCFKNHQNSKVLKPPQPSPYLSLPPFSFKQKLAFNLFGPNNHLRPPSLPSLLFFFLSGPFRTRRPTPLSRPSLSRRPAPPSLSLWLLTPRPHMSGSSPTSLHLPMAASHALLSPASSPLPRRFPSHHLASSMCRRLLLAPSPLETAAPTRAPPPSMVAGHRPRPTAFGAPIPFPSPSIKGGPESASTRTSSRSCSAATASRLERRRPLEHRPPDLLLRRVSRRP